jgi:hypothetical protein
VLNICEEVGFVDATILLILNPQSYESYIKDITDISTLSVGFVQVLIVHLAYMLAGKLTQSDGAVDELMNEYKMLESRAMVLNQRERNNTLTTGNFTNIFGTNAFIYSPNDTRYHVVQFSTTFLI